jgi:hypothetical protein
MPPWSLMTRVSAVTTDERCFRIQLTVVDSIGDCFFVPYAITLGELTFRTITIDKLLLSHCQSLDIRSTMSCRTF